jgi:hypothetical protein
VEAAEKRREEKRREEKRREEKRREEKRREESLASAGNLNLIPQSFSPQPSYYTD